jgi:hypothetical protein
MFGTIHDMFHAFFIGMLNGYTQTSIKFETVTKLPKSKLISGEVTGTGITITDCWQTTPLTRKSFGTTTLSCPEGIIWMMQYWGEYPDKVIPFLRKALYKSYSEHKFIGGRGPHYFTDGKYIYINIPSSNDFDNFEGGEHILDEEGNVLGWHKYHGMKMWK